MVAFREIKTKVLQIVELVEPGRSYLRRALRMEGIRGFLSAGRRQAAYEIHLIKKLLRIPGKQAWAAVGVIAVSLVAAVGLYKAEQAGGRAPAALAENVPAADAGKPMVLGASITARGTSDTEAARPPRQIGDFDTESVSAESFLIYDPASGTVLLEKDADKKLSVGSLTKLLTGLVAYEHLNFTAEATITPGDILNVNPNLDFRAGERILVSDLFNAMLVGSANDAALALSHITGRAAGEDFVSLMNKTAQELGMSDSHFSNPMGFDSNYNYSTARDLLKLVRKTQTLAAFTNLGRDASYSFRSSDGTPYRVAATNKLIKKYANIEAIKTGYTANTAGAMIAKFSQEGHSVIVIVLGSQNREGDTVMLGNAAFEGFEWR